MTAVAEQTDEPEPFGLSEFRSPLRVQLNLGPGYPGRYADATMAILEHHDSPDETLRLTLDLTNGDWTIGFAGHPWHTHGDILHACGCGGCPEEAARTFVREIISSQREICVYRRDGMVIDVSIPGLYDDRPLAVAFAKYAPPNETIEIRYWDGRQVIE